MAYKKRLYKRECQQVRCNNKARYDVFNNRNGLVGEYCTEHAVTKIESLNRSEKESKEEL